MDNIHRTDAFFIANQLIRIAKMETDVQNNFASALVMGDDETADAVSEMLGCLNMKNVAEIERYAAKNKGKSFAAVFLFIDIPDELLEQVTTDNSVVIDMIDYQKEGTVYYNNSHTYRRIRVVSLLRNEKF